MLILKQSDPKWGSTKMNGSYATLSRYGCLVTSLSMLSSYFGAYRTPKALAKGLSFTKEGLLIWGSMPKLLPFKLEERLYSRDDRKIKGALAHPDKAVVLQVQNHSHWVVWLGTYKYAPWVYRIADPLFGKKVAFPFSGYSNITGAAILTKK